MGWLLKASSASAAGGSELGRMVQAVTTRSSFWARLSVAVTSINAASDSCTSRLKRFRVVIGGTLGIWYCFEDAPLYQRMHIFVKLAVSICLSGCISGVPDRGFPGRFGGVQTMLGKQKFNAVVLGLSLFLGLAVLGYLLGTYAVT